MRNPPSESLRRAAFGAALGVLAALPLFVYLRGFTVDDALIPARYAANLAAGAGYRFNTHGPVTDGVTPLGFPYLLAPFAAGGPLAALAAARTLGAIAWLAASAALGAAVARLSGSPLRYASLLLVACSAPLAAWSSAGLETGWTIAFATFAAVLPTRGAMSPAAGALLGACAWLRPEMIAYSGWLGIVRARAAETRKAAALTVVLATGPWLVAGVIRAVVFGRPAPLAIVAKPSDLTHGAIYVLPAILFTGAPLAALAPFTWIKQAAWPRALAVAAFVHLGVIWLAGGDWMPLARLVTPVLPPLAFSTAHLLLTTTRAARVTLARLALGCAAEIYVTASRGPTAAHVLRDRLALIDAVRPVLAGATKVATIDVGWVGAATDAEILDLAGATDPEIAALPGGHTSKAVSGAFLTGRATDRLVLQIAAKLADDAIVPERVAEVRLFRDPLVRRFYRTTWRSPGTHPVQYIVMSRTESSSLEP